MIFLHSAEKKQPQKNICRFLRSSVKSGRYSENVYGEDVQILIPFNQGAEADGQYSRAVRCVLDRLSYDKTAIVSPILERLTENAKDIDCLMRALVFGDMIYLTENNLIEKYDKIPTWEQSFAILPKIQ